jgi:hypothetical protein
MKVAREGDIADSYSVVVTRVMELWSMVHYMCNEWLSDSDYHLSKLQAAEASWLQYVNTSNSTFLMSRRNMNN